MISNITGVIVDIETSRIVLQVQENLGLSVIIPSAYFDKDQSNLKLNDVIKLYTIVRIKEEEFLLYGFRTPEERDLFIKLIAINGVGPRIALAIIGNLTVNGFYEAINNANLIAFKSISGVGDKTAKRILIEFKAQIPSFPTELFDALSSMGFSRNEIYSVWNKLTRDKIDIHLANEELVKLFLRHLKK